jgi:ABC-type glycerol-3-phosphate transport system substrate-binding protein
MKKKLITIVCLILTCALIWLAPMLANGYPVEREGLIRHKGWEGTLRVWVCQSWSSGFNAWLSNTIAAFEKAHSGIRVRVQRVQPGAWNVPDVVLPDILLFAPGSLDNPQDILKPFGKTDVFIEEAMRSGKWMGEQYALPVALGGYVVIVNEALYPAEHALADPGVYKKTKRYALAASGVGLAALLEWDEGKAAARAFDLPEGFGTGTNDQMYAKFTQGNVAALVSTLDYARKFAAREAAGKGFVYRVETPNIMEESESVQFCDMVIHVGRTKTDGDAGRTEAADALTFALISKEAQTKLAEYGLIPALEAVSIPNNYPLINKLYQVYQTQLALPNTYAWNANRSAFINEALHAVKNGGFGIYDAIERLR